MRTFDSNAMANLAALKRAKGGGRRKDGLGKVITTKAYYDRQTADMTEWQRLVYETLHRWRTTCSIHQEHYRLDCRFYEKGFYDGEAIPF